MTTPTPSTSTSSQSDRRRRLIRLLLILCFFVGTAVFVAMYVPAIGEKVVGWCHDTPLESFAAGLFSHGEHGHDHEHSAATGASSSSLPQTQPVEIALSSIAAKNIGLDDTAIEKIKVVDYYKSLTIPATVVERPGKSTITVPAPVSGVVSKIYFEKGVSIKPGEPLFDILLNQQEMVKGQAEYILLLKKQDIVNSELERLSGIDPQIVPKQLRELEFQKAEIDLSIKLQKNTLILQGLTIEDIVNTLECGDEMIQSITIFAPEMSEKHRDGMAEFGTDHTFTIEDLYITHGKNVEIGESLCLLSDLCEVAIQGKVFAVHAQNIKHSLDTKKRVSVVFDAVGGRRETIDGLQLRSIDNYIDTINGTLFCYVDLHNHAETYQTAADANDSEHFARHYTNWHFKPGQRCEMNVEYESLPNCIVLPVDAVAQDLNEMCVFEWVGNEDDKRIWRKKPVHVLYTTKNVVAIANDGAVFPGAKVATRGASFILAALNIANQRSSGSSSGGIQHGDHVH